MSDPASVPNEKVLWQGSVSHLHYLAKWIVILLLLAATVGSFFVPVPDSATIVLWAGRAAVLVVAVFIAGWIQLDRRRRKYAVTNKRVSVEYGIVNRTSNEIRIQDVRSINLRQKGISGLIGIGTVEFSSAATDDADVVFWNTPEATKVRDLVRSLQA